MWPILLCLTLVAAALPAPTQARTPETISVRVQTPTYEINAQGVDVPGYDRDDRPGAPALPVWRTVVELPARGDWQLSYDSPGAQVLAQTVNVPATPVPDLAPFGTVHGKDPADLPSAVPTTNRPDPAIYGANAFYPASPVVAGTVQWRQGQRLLPLQVFPFQYNPVTRQLRYHPDLAISVHLTPARAAGAGDASADPSAASGQALSMTGAAGAGDASAALSMTGALRVRTAGRGLYRLTYDDLLAAGVPLATTDVATFSMSYRGQPVAIELLDNGDASFDPGELVLFYAQPYQGRYESNNVYWFTYGGDPGLRMAQRTVTPTGSEPVVTTITRTLHVENNIEYRSDFPRPQDADHWFDTPLSPDDLAGTSTLTRTYTLPVVDPLSGGAARIQAALHGGANRPPNPDKSIALTLNSHPVALHQWEGMTYFVSDDSVPSDWLDGAPNRIHLTASTAQLPGIGFYSVSPDWVRITYPSLASAQGDRLYIEAMAEGAAQVAASGFTTSTIRVYDLRDPSQPVRLLTTAAQPAGGGYTISFWDEDLPGPAYYLSSVAALSAPAAIAPDLPSSWRMPGHQADYIAVVHRSLWDAIDPLLAHRTADGMAVAKVDVQDIYDEWNDGLRDPEAIRGFLRYAYHCWNGADCDPLTPPPNPPTYVLLVGDGHYDFTGASGTTYPNLIPPYLIHIDPWLGETAADNRYASVDGPDDYLPEMALGRVPARTPADVTAVVNKIIAYESAPAGPWQERVVFVADNYLDPAGNFHALSNDVRLNWLPAAYSDSTIYYNADYFSGAAMRTAIKAAFDADALVIQWFGHGSRFRWGSVSMFNILDVPTLASNNVWPFTASYTCWTGYFINLLTTGNGQSLGEALLLTPQRGSVADLSPSGLHIGDALLIFNRGLTQAQFQQRIKRVGLAVDEAKYYYYSNTASFPDVIDTMVLFGDPATKLRLPEAELANSSAAVSPGAALPGETLRYTVTVQNDGPAALPDAAVRVDYDQEAGQVTGSSPAASDAGGVLTWNLPSLAPGATVLTFDLLLNPVQPAGVTPIHAPTTVEAWGVLWAELDPTSQVSAAPNLSGSSLHASRAWAPPALPLTYTLTLSNTGDAPSAMTWLTATLPADLVDVSSIDLVYDEQAHRLTWQGATPAAAPAVTLRFRAAIAPERSACGPIEVAAMLRDQLGQVSPLAASVQPAVPDVDCDGDVDIADIQLVAAAWGASLGDPGYHPRYDLDGDDLVGVLDIVMVAARWQ